jgi:hypothetical protein
VKQQHVSIGDADIQRIVSELSPASRRWLGGALGGSFDIIDNIDVMCPIDSPPCHQYFRFPALRELLTRLRE